LEKDANIDKEPQDNAESECIGNVAENKVEETEHVTHHPKSHHSLAKNVKKTQILNFELEAFGGWLTWALQTKIDTLQTYFIPYVDLYLQFWMNCGRERAVSMRRAVTPNTFPTHGFQERRRATKVRARLKRNVAWTNERMFVHFQNAVMSPSKSKQAPVLVNCQLQVAGEHTLKTSLALAYQRNYVRMELCTSGYFRRICTHQS
jgi:hypothetical protein